MTSSMVLTGADRGLGRALARQFSGLGYKVFPHLFDQTAGDPFPLNGGLTSFGDLKDDEVVLSLCHAIEAIEDLSLVILVAAAFPRAPIDTLPQLEWQNIIKLNLTAPFLLAQAAFRSFKRRRRGGKIIFVSSVSADTGSPSGAHYAASKAGINTLAKCFSRSGQKDGIFAYAVSPGLLDTEMSRGDLDDAGFDALIKTMPQERATELEEMVELVSYLSECDRGALSGQVIRANGGTYI